MSDLRQCSSCSMHQTNVHINVRTKVSQNYNMADRCLKSIILSVSLCFTKGLCVFLPPGDGAASGEGDQQCYRPTQPRGGHAQVLGVHLYRHPVARSHSKTCYVNKVQIFIDLFCHIFSFNLCYSLLIQMVQV